MASSFVENINKVAALIPAEVVDLGVVADNIDNINLLTPVITDLQSIVDNVVPNIAEILLADDNASIATTKASEASTSASKALASEVQAGIYAGMIAISVDTIENMTAISLPQKGQVVVVRDENRGGVFIYRPTGVANGGTIFDSSSTGKWYRQYDAAVNVKWFGAVGDGVSDDTVAIQSAFISGCKELNGGGHTYKVNDTVILNKDMLISDMVLNFSEIPSASTCLLAEGIGAIESSVLSANAISGTYSVLVSDGTKFTAGDYVMLIAEDAYNYSAATVKRGEIKQIQSISSDTINFREAIYETYTTSNSASLKKLSLLDNITLERVKIIGTNTEADKNIGIKFNYCKNITVRDCFFENIDLYELALYNTIDFTIDNNKFDGVRYTGLGAAFYGVVLFNCCQWGTVSNNIGQELRHLVTTSSTAAYYGQPYFITVCQNIMRNAMAGDAYASWAYENHGFGRWITWSNNQADSCHTGINIEKGDQIITGNIFTNCSFNGIYFDADGRELNNIIIANNRISKSTMESASGNMFGISIALSASQVRSNILITDNIIDGFSYAGRADFGIRVFGGSGNAVGCVISNNIIRNSGAYEANDYGIYIEQAGWTIQGNTIVDYERGCSFTASANECMLSNNSFIVQSKASTQNCVAISSSSCVVTGNIFRGVYRAISIGGSGNVVDGNHGVGITTSISNTDLTSIWYDNITPRDYSLTIASGAIQFPKAIASNGGLLTILTEASASTDDLDTISGGTAGQLIVLRTFSSLQDVVCKDGTGNLSLNGDFTLSHPDDKLTLVSDGTKWFEVARSDNTL